MIPRRVVVVSLAIAVSVLGDATLYTVLPIYAEELGIRITLVGILLSANRFVRLLTNSWAGAVHDRLDNTWPFLIALVFGAVTTTVYGMLWGFWAFLMARIVWGTCWSFLRLEGYAAVIACSQADNRGRLMGFHKSIVGSGMMAGGFLGGVLTEAIGYRNCLLVFAGLTLLGAIMLLLDQTHGPRKPRATSPLRPEALPNETEGVRTSITPPSDHATHFGVPPQWFLYAMAFTNVLVNGGVIGSTLGRLLKLRFGLTIVVRGLAMRAGVATGGLVFFRWLGSFLLAPVVGHLADRFGRRTLLLLGLTASIIAWAALITQEHFLWIGLFAVVISVARTTISVSLDASVVDLTSRHALGKLVSRYVTFMDFGSACGPLISYLLLGIQLKLEWVYLGGLCLLMLLGVGAIAVRYQTDPSHEPIDQ